MYTYFITNKVNSLVKIGKAKDVSKRIRQLQSCMQFLNLRILHKVEGDFERAFHQLYRKHHHSGEWFDMPKLTKERIDVDYQLLLSNHSPEEQDQPDFYEELCDKLWEYLQVDFSMDSVNKWVLAAMLEDGLIYKKGKVQLPDFPIACILIQTKTVTVSYHKGMEPIKMWIDSFGFDCRITIVSYPLPGEIPEQFSKNIVLEDNY